MNTFYLEYKLMQDKVKTAEEEAALETLCRQAKAGKHGQRSRLLVKLAGMLINAGINLKAYAEGKPVMTHSV